MSFQIDSNTLALQNKVTEAKEQEAVAYDNYEDGMITESMYLDIMDNTERVISECIKSGLSFKDC